MIFWRVMENTHTAACEIDWPTQDTAKTFNEDVPNAVQQKQNK